MQVFVAEITNRDRVELSVDDKQQLLWKAKGCYQLLKEVDRLRGLQLKKDDFIKLSFPKKDHVSLLLKELKMKLEDSYHPPYTEKELCHCRAVETKKVLSSIMIGGDTCAKVGTLCSAGTSCGNCQPDINASLQFILGDS